jgi:hypothetical protein
MTTHDPLSPQWEDCKVCGGDHWTKDHPDLRLPPEKQGPMNGTPFDPRDTPEAVSVDGERLADALDEWLAYAKQSKVPEIDTEWADGYRQGWVAAYTLMEADIAGRRIGEGELTALAPKETR